jgi:dissimilatory sulfite reductase (desulfoviridin) alpha/beta subunit
MGCTLALLPPLRVAFPWDMSLINTGRCPHLQSDTRSLAHRTGVGWAVLTHEECSQQCPLQAVRWKCRNITIQTRQCLPL